MSGNGDGRPGVAQKAMVTLATMVSLVLLGLVLAYWFWEWFAPPPEPRAAVAIDAPSRALAADALFGNAQKGNNAGERAAGMPIKLLGVAAASGDHYGHAVFQLDGKRALAVREGEEILPNVLLAEVHADHVVLDRKGVREKLVLPRK